MTAARRFDSEDVFVASALVDFYAKCGRMAQARQVFDKITHPNVVSWTTLINGYADSGDGELALEAFGRMLLSGCQADSRAFVAVLMACSILATKGRAPAKQNGGKNIKEKCLQRGVAIHSLVEERHCGSDPFVASTLVDMYTNCGSLDDARNVFDKMPSHGVVSWTALVMGYAENGSGEIALELFSRMIFEGCDPNPRTYVAALVACGSLAALQTGKQLVHALVCKAGVESEVYVANSLVNFYGTCGSMGDAEQVFDSVKNKTVFTWSAMIEGYSHQGDARHVFATFWKMKDEGMEPNGVTFVSLLTACSHAGLVEQGREFFQAMRLRHRIEPGLEHYHCMVDSLGRANLFEEAVAMVERMPFEANEITWTIMLAACRKWKKVELGEQAFEKLVEMGEKQETAYLLMADLYGSVGMREQQSKLLGILTRSSKQDGIEQGCSSSECNR